MITEVEVNKHSSIIARVEFSFFDVLIIHVFADHLCCEHKSAGLLNHINLSEEKIIYRLINVLKIMPRAVCKELHLRTFHIILFN